MALGFDTSASGDITANVGITLSITIAANTDRLLYVVIRWWDDSAEVPATCTHAGSGLSNVARSAASAGNDRVDIWRIINPNSGTANIVVPASIGNQATGRVTGVSLYGGHQTTPERDTSTATGNSTGPAVTVDTQAGDWIIDGLAADGSGAPSCTMDADTGRTQIENVIGSDERTAVSRHEAPDTSQVMGWTFSAARNWAMAGVSVIPAAALPPVPNPPTDLTAVIQSSTSVRLEWTDNSSDETGFEVWRRRS